MPSNISYSLTIKQFKARTKDVTRRLGWNKLKPGTILMGCEKCQGIKAGELKRLGKIRVVSVRQEQLSEMLHEPYGSNEAAREGFPELNGKGFVDMFCEHMKCDPGTVVNRIEYEYLDESHEQESKPGRPRTRRNNRRRKASQGDASDRVPAACSEASKAAVSAST